MSVCSVEGCESPVRARGWCNAHYLQWKSGRPPRVIDQSPLARLMAKIEHRPGSDCWWWTAQTARGGYGRFKFQGRLVAAHRVSYTLHVGPIPDGLTLDHLCRNPPCVNPAHLEPVTCRENILRGNTLAAINAAKVECFRGHPLSGENLYVGPDGHRHCRICGRMRFARYRAKRRSVA